MPAPPIDPPDVRSFGALGDGTLHQLVQGTIDANTSPSDPLKLSGAWNLDRADTNDTADWLGIALALRYAKVNGIRHVHMPAGRYVIRRPIPYIWDDIDLIGDGPEATTVLNDQPWDPNASDAYALFNAYRTAAIFIGGFSPTALATIPAGGDTRERSPEFALAAEPLAFGMAVVRLATAAQATALNFPPGAFVAVFDPDPALQDAAGLITIPAIVSFSRVVSVGVAGGVVRLEMPLDFDFPASCKIRVLTHHAILDVGSPRWFGPRTAKYVIPSGGSIRGIGFATTGFRVSAEQGWYRGRLEDCTFASARGGFTHNLLWRCEVNRVRSAAVDRPWEFKGYARDTWVRNSTFVDTATVPKPAGDLPEELVGVGEFVRGGGFEDVTIMSSAYHKGNVLSVYQIHDFTLRRVIVASLDGTAPYTIVAASSANLGLLRIEDMAIRVDGTTPPLRYLSVNIDCVAEIDGLTVTGPADALYTASAVELRGRAANGTVDQSRDTVGGFHARITLPDGKAVNVPPGRYARVAGAWPATFADLDGSTKRGKAALKHSAELSLRDARRTVRPSSGRAGALWYTDDDAPAIADPAVLRDADDPLNTDGTVTALLPSSTLYRGGSGGNFAYWHNVLAGQSGASAVVRPRQLPGAFRHTNSTIPALWYNAQRGISCYVLAYTASHQNRSVPLSELLPVQVVTATSTSLVRHNGDNIDQMLVGEWCWDLIGQLSLAAGAVPASWVVGQTLTGPGGTPPICKVVRVWKAGAPVSGGYQNRYTSDLVLVSMAQGVLLPNGSYTNGDSAAVFASASKLVPFVRLAGGADPNNDLTGVVPNGTPTPA